MTSSSFIHVKKSRIDEGKWIENTPEEKQKAVTEGYIFQSIYEYSHIPDKDKAAPLCKGDMFIFAEAPSDPPQAILALKVLLRNLKNYYPDVDLSMLHYYVEYDEKTDTGMAFVRIPAELFGSEMPCIRQSRYHWHMLEKFLSCVNQTPPLSLNEIGRERYSDKLFITDVINPCQYLQPGPIMWLPPDYSFYDGKYKLFTVEIDPESFMESRIDDLWAEIARGSKWFIQNNPPDGSPLEELYLQAQYVPTLYEDIEKNKRSLSLCAVYKNIEANPELLTDIQMKKAISLFVPLGKDGLEMAYKLFVSKHGYTREQVYSLFLEWAYNRGKILCSEIQGCFSCPGDCGEKSPWQLEVKKLKDNRILQNFRLTDDGLYYSDKGFSDEDIEPVKLCSRFEVVAKMYDIDGTGWSKLVSLKDADGNRKLIRIPLKECQGNSVFQILVDNGLEIISIRPARKITAYFMANNPAKIIRSTSKLGWHDNIFVLPEQNIGYGKDNILFSGNSDKFQITGNLSDWQENVGKYCAGNTMLMLLVAYALTGSLLRPLELEGGGLHLYGSSSVGKTTQAMVAGSVWGGNKNKGYLTQWRITANALEKIASSHNDGFLILDEIGEATSDDVNQISYMLANGHGKERMRADSSLRNVSTWKLNFLSTGELPLTEKISETGKRNFRAGQTVRMVDLPVMATGKYGVFENLHGCNSGAEFSHLLKTNASMYYGSPIRVFIKVLCGVNQEEMFRNLAEIEANRREFIKKNCPKGSSCEVQRVVERFALIAAAGVFACKNDILPWSAAEAESVAAKWFNIWIDERGTLGSKEIENAINKLKDHWALYCNSKYMDRNITNNYWSGDRKSGYKWTDNRTGQLVCFMLPDEFSELTKGCNRTELMNELNKRGMLLLTKEGKPKDTISLDGKTIRGVALLFPEKINEEDEDYIKIKDSASDLDDNNF